MLIKTGNILSPLLGVHMVLIYSFISLLIFMGIVYGFIVFLKNKKEAVTSIHEAMETQIHDLTVKYTQLIQELNQEVQKLQHKLLKTEERCLSYQKLVDLHQEEVKALKQENLQLGEEVIQKERQINELSLAQLEPNLFDFDKRKKETSYRELKKVYDEKSQALDKIKNHLFEIESKYLILKKSTEEEMTGLNKTELSLIEQLKTSEDEKKKLEAELMSLHQLVATLSGPTSSKKRKSKAALGSQPPAQ